MSLEIRKIIGVPAGLIWIGMVLYMTTHEPPQSWTDESKYMAQAQADKSREYDAAAPTPPPGFGTPVAVVDPAPKAHVDREWEEFKNLVIGLLLLFGEYIVLPFGLLMWACWVFGSLFNGLSDIHASNVARHLERPKDFKDGVEKTSKDILAECEAHHQEQRRLWTVEDVRLRRELAVDKRNDSPRPTDVGICPEFEKIKDHINHNYNPNAPWRSVMRDEKAGVPRTKNSLGYDNSEDKYFKQEVARMGWNARPLTADEVYGIISDFEFRRNLS